MLWLTITLVLVALLAVLGNWIRGWIQDKAGPEDLTLIRCACCGGKVHVTRPPWWALLLLEVLGSPSVGLVAFVGLLTGRKNFNRMRVLGLATLLDRRLQRGTVTKPETEALLKRVTAELGLPYPLFNDDGETEVR